MSKQTYPYYVPVKISSGQLLKIYKDKKFKSYTESYDVLQYWFKKYQKNFYEHQYAILEYIDQYDCKIVTIFTKGIETRLLNTINYKDFIDEQNIVQNTPDENYEDMRIECYECHTVVNFHEDDIVDGYYVICPRCGEHLVILP